MRLHGFPIAAISMIILLLLSCPTISPGADLVLEANRGQEGQSFDIKTLPVKGQVTIIDFYSPFCPPCVRLAPILEELAKRKKNIRIAKLNINRPGYQGIDWKSPLAQQYLLKSVPYFVIYDQKGQRLAEGKKAMDMIMDWIKQAGLMRN